MSLQTLINSLEAEPHDMAIVQHLCSPLKVRAIEYDELESMKPLMEVMDYVDAIVILYTMKSHPVGHFCCFWLSEDRSTVEYFDPYGLSPTEDMDVTHNPHTLLQYFGTKKVNHNQWRLQKLKQDINTCLYHCSLRLRFMTMSHDQYRSFVHSSNLKPDTVVCLTQFLVQPKRMPKVLTAQAEGH